MQLSILIYSFIRCNLSCHFGDTKAACIHKCCFKSCKKRSQNLVKKESKSLKALLWWVSTYICISKRSQNLITQLAFYSFSWIWPLFFSFWPTNYCLSLSSPQTVQLDTTNVQEASVYNLIWLGQHCVNVS